MKKWENSQKIKTICSWLCFTLAVSNLGFANKKDVFTRTWTQIPDTQARKIYRDIRSEDQFWVLTSNALYLTQNQKSAKLILNKTVHWLYQSQEEPNLVYVVTDDGLSFSEDDKTWRELLHERECQSLTSVGTKLFVGTKKGLLLREGEDSRWTKASGKLSKESVYLLASFGEVVYVVTPTSLYRYNAASNDYKIIFSTGLSQESEEPIETNEEGGVNLTSEIIDIDFQDSGAIYITSRKGIYFSIDHGENWESISLKGLSFNSINNLAIEPVSKQIWVATDDGVYKLEDDRWGKIYKGLPTNSIKDIAINKLGNVYAATIRGFFVLLNNNAIAMSKDFKGVKSLFDNYNDVEKYFDNEPTIRQVQSMAVEYADVHPDKIKRWHRQSRLKALVPTLSSGIDRSASDLIHWDTGPNPDVISKGRDFVDWDINLSWDLGEMVWSSDQTSIDSRSKLMVELREEVLDQVTRIYFERRRVQLSLLSDDDNSNVLDDEMRLSELTAILDGYTGGRFSRSITARS